jgi:Family of unknown function (DUF6152)
MVVMRIWKIVVALGFAGLVPLDAHHSQSAIFDMSKKVQVTATLTKVDWLNPHIRLYFESKDASGRTEPWVFESNPPAWFRRVSVNKATFSKVLGQTVTVEGVRARDGSAYGYMSKFTFPDKTSFEVVFDRDVTAPNKD